MSTDPELSELRVQLDKMQQERDYWQAESGRFRTGLAQMQDKLVDLSEKAYIIKQSVKIQFQQDSQKLSHSCLL